MDSYIKVWRCVQCVALNGHNSVKLSHLRDTLWIVLRHHAVDGRGHIRGVKRALNNKAGYNRRSKDADAMISASTLAQQRPNSRLEVRIVSRCDSCHRPACGSGSPFGDRRISRRIHSEPSRINRHLHRG